MPSKRMVEVLPGQYIDPEKIVMVKAVSNTKHEELTRIWLEGIGTTGVTVKGRPTVVLHALSAANPAGYASVYV